MPATVSPPAPTDTRTRLLDAAFRVCAQRGLAGSTTREIAEAAGVNEVTLFRHFGSKEKLLAALLQRSVEAQAAFFSAFQPQPHNLRRDLARYARRYNEMLFQHEPLIRTIIGESPRHPEHARLLIAEAVRPLRDRVIAYLREAQRAGFVRRPLALAPAVDAFTGMLLAGMLRRTAYPAELGYEHRQYLATCLQLFVRGVAP